MAEFKLTAENVRKGLKALGEQCGGAKQRKIAGVLKNPFGFGALNLRIKLKARGEKFGSFQDFLTWLIEHQEEIFSFISKIIALFSVAIAIGFVLAMLFLPSQAAAQDCPCGDSCQCTVESNCGAAGCSAAAQSDAIKLRKFAPLAYVQQSRVASKARYRQGKREDRRDNRKANRRGG